MNIRTLLILSIAFSMPAVSNSSVSVMPFEYATGPSATSIVFDAFHAHRQHNGVALAWTTSEVSITSFVIQHSYDGATFVTIDEVSPEASGRNNYRHDGAWPGYNYYRIGAKMSNGTTEYSDVEVVRMVQRK